MALSKTEAQNTQSDLLKVWNKLQTQPQSNERAGLLASCRKQADAIAKESGVASMLPSTSTSGGGKLAAMLAAVVAERTSDAQDTDAS